MSFKIIYELVSFIPLGKVLTYKRIAEILRIKDIRLVGFALHQNKLPIIVPCHRVIKSNGLIASGYAYGGREKQRELLKKEKVSFIGKYQVDLNKSFWHVPKNIVEEFNHKKSP